MLFAGQGQSELAYSQHRTHRISQTDHFREMYALVGTMRFRAFLPRLSQKIDSYNVAF